MGTLVIPRPRKKNGSERTPTNLKDNGIPSMQKWWDISKKLGNPVFKGISALNRGILKRKGGLCTVHFNEDSSNTELVFRTIHSATPLSTYGDQCEELAQWIPGQNELTVEKSAAKENKHYSKHVKPQGVTNSKEQRWSIWKQTARTTSEIRNT